MGGFVGSSTVLAATSEPLEGPPLTSVLARIEPVPGLVAGEIFEHEGGELTEFWGFEVIDSVCEEGADTFWGNVDGTQAVELIACRTGSSMSANNVAKLQLTVTGCPVAEEEVAESIAFAVNISSAECELPVEDGLVLIEAWNEADVAIFVRSIDMPLDDPEMDAWVEVVHSEFRNEEYSAPLFLQPAQIAGAVLGFGMGSLGALVAVRGLTRLIRARRRRLNARAMIDVSSQAKELRWFGRTVGVLQGGAFVLLPLAFLASLGPMSFLFAVPFASALPIAVYVVAVAAVSSLFRRVDGERRRWYGSPTSSLRSFLLALVAAGCLVIGLGTYTVLAAGSSFPLDYRNDLPAEVQALFSAGIGLLFIFGVMPMASVSAGSIFFRLSHRYRLARLDDLDHSPDEVTLLLRSFSDDRIRIPASASARRGLFDAWTVRATDRFEEVITWELASRGPVAAVSDKRALGAARVRVDDDDWQQWVEDRQNLAPLVVMVLGQSEGLAWEVAKLIENRHLTKTLFLVPPVSPSVVAQRWSWLGEVARSSGLELQQSGTDEAIIHDCLAFLLGPSGGVTTISADRRDEAGYRAAVDAGVRRLQNQATFG